MAVIEAVIKFRRGTASAWATADPVLASGELGYETDTGRYKFGDGVSVWTDLVYKDLAETIADSTAIGRSMLTAANDVAVKTLLSLNNVSNTSDVNKPVSTLQGEAIANTLTTATGRAVAFSIAL